MNADRRQELAEVTERLRVEPTVPAVLAATARSLVDLLDAQGCTISRAIGDLLVDLVEHRRTGEPSPLGHGYLLSDYPLTREVLEHRAPRTVSIDDPEADESEVRLLERLGFGSLVMAPLEAEEDAWGLIEIYGEKGRRFGDADVGVVVEVAREAGRRLSQLQQRA